MTEWNERPVSDDEKLAERMAMDYEAPILREPETDAPVPHWSGELDDADPGDGLDAGPTREAEA